MKISALFATAAVVAGLTAAASASAAVVTMDARSFGGGVTFTDSASYVNEWNTVLTAQPTPPPGYGDQTITNWNGGQHNSGVFGANTNLAYHDQVTFNVAPGQTGNWAFRLGIDFGYGGTFLVDGVAVQTNTNDLWWNGNIGDTSQTLFGMANLAAGTHVLDVYGFESCCDGGTEGQYLSPGSKSFADFAVPEPTSWALMIGGLGMTGFALRRRTQKIAA